MSQNIVNQGTDKILIVQPDLSLANFLSEQLKERGGYQSVIASSVESAINALNVSEINVVLTDQLLDGKTGFELAFEIRREKATKPEIIMMSQDLAVSVFEAHQVGVAHILQKPINVEELINVVKRVAGEKRRFDRAHISGNQTGLVTGDIQSVSRQNLDVEISNIGRGGFFYKVANDSDLPPIGQIVDFKIKLGMVPHHNFAGRGIVRWIKKTKDETGSGVEFLLIPEESESLISAFVDLFKVKEFVPAE